MRRDPAAIPGSGSISSRRSRAGAGGRRAGAARTPSGCRARASRAGAARGVDGAELSAREEPLAVRLDEVRLVDPLLLHVRAGVVDALHRSGGGSGGGGGAAGSPRRRPPGPPRPCGPTKRLVCPSRSRAAGRRCRRRSAASCRRPPAPSGCLPHAGGHDRQRRERATSTESHHIGYTPPPRNRHTRRCGVRIAGNNLVRGVHRGSRKEHRMSLLWIILIVVLVLALLGFSAAAASSRPDRVAD